MSFLVAYLSLILNNSFVVAVSEPHAATEKVKQMDIVKITRKRARCQFNIDNIKNPAY